MTRTPKPVYTTDLEVLKLWVRLDQLPDKIPIGLGHYIDRDVYIAALKKLNQESDSEQANSSEDL